MWLLVLKDNSVFGLGSQCLLRIWNFCSVLDKQVIFSYDKGMSNRNIMGKILLLFFLILISVWPLDLVLEQYVCAKPGSCTDFEAAVMLLLIGVYYLPFIILPLTTSRGLLQLFAFLNLILAWTGIGWIGLLIWSISIRHKQKTVSL